MCDETETGGSSLGVQSAAISVEDRAVLELAPPELQERERLVAPQTRRKENI